MLELSGNELEIIILFWTRLSTFHLVLENVELVLDGCIFSNQRFKVYGKFIYCLNSCTVSLLHLANTQTRFQTFVNEF